MKTNCECIFVCTLFTIQYKPHPYLSTGFQLSRNSFSANYFHHFFTISIRKVLNTFDTVWIRCWFYIFNEKKINLFVYTSILYIDTTANLLLHHTIYSCRLLLLITIICANMSHRLKCASLYRTNGHYNSIHIVGKMSKSFRSNVLFDASVTLRRYRATAVIDRSTWTVWHFTKFHIGNTKLNAFHAILIQIEIRLYILLSNVFMELFDFFLTNFV